MSNKILEMVQLLKMSIFASVLIFISLLGSVSGVTLNIIPSVNHPCPTNTCLTFSHFYANTSSFLQDNTTLIFQPGNFTVRQELVISRVSNFSMLSDHTEAYSRVIIMCNAYASISFREIDSVYISGLTIEYVGFDVDSISRFSVKDCVFARYTQSSIQFYNSNASVASTMFTLNSVGSYQGQLHLTIVPLAVGGALSVSESNVTLTNCTFEKNRAGAGGAIFSNLRSNITINNCMFRENTVHCFDCLGAVMYAEDASSVQVYNSTFEGNSAVGYGGVIAVTQSTINIQFSHFAFNKADKGGVIYAKDSNNLIIMHSLFVNNSANISGGVITEISTEVSVSNCTFTGNRAGRYAGVMDAFFDPVFVNGSTFKNNSAVNYGGVFVGTYVDFSINNTKFFNNSARVAGVLYAFSKASAVFENCTLKLNAAKQHGGAIFAHRSQINVSTSVFAYNDAHSGGVLYCQVNTVLHLNRVTIENNNAEQGVLYCIESTVVFSNNANYSGNKASLFLYYSKVYFRGNTNFINNTLLLKTEAKSLHNEGGAITAFQSEIYFETDTKCIIKNNTAERGGGILAIASKLFINGNLSIVNNTASASGGGVYLYQSEQNCKGQSILELIGNSASKRGGGIHAISSIVTAEYNYDISVNLYMYIYTGSKIMFIENTAGEAGGGICLEVSAKINILNINKNDSEKPLYTLQFIQNSADYGGAVYVADNTNSVTCMALSNGLQSASTECFLQTLVIVIAVQQESNARNANISVPVASLTNTLFERNRAYTHGSTLYGGLLDRCILSPFIKRGSSPFYSDISDNKITHDGVTYFRSTTTITDDNPTSVSSDAVQVCFCKSGTPDCDYQPQSLLIKKGENFNVSLVAVDQVKNVVSAIIYSSLSSNESGIGEGQLFQSVGDTCSELNFNVFSPNDNEELILYADGPCKDAPHSQRRIQIQFQPCSCLIGFQPTSDLTATRCTCECDSSLTQLVSNLKCDPETQSFEREFNFWIDYINDDGDSRAGYLFNPHCPLDYCQPASSRVKINLNIPNGADAQCANNRHGLLCGSCKKGFSLSLGSSSCNICPTYWPATCILILLAALVSGIALVALLLILNLTVAVGTLNGIIFYANIVASSSFFPSSSPTFASVFIAWLNLDFGINTCFFDGLNAYWKTWLQLCFPLYIIFLVVIIIVVSNKSKRFSELIGKKDPVATLATLILFSYAKLLHTAITALSSAVLVYPNGPPNTVWLSDATVGYFKREHIPLFLVAVIILLSGIVYTVALFSWQWILRFNESKYLKWTRNQKLSLFIFTYHAPYTPMNRYWTGLLLFVRVIIFVASTANVSGDPSLNLLIIGSGMTGVLVLMKLVSVSSQVYKKWQIEFIEVVCYVNVILLSLAIFFSKNDRMKAQAINISVSITFILLVGILLYHICTEVIFPKLCRKNLEGASPQETECEQTDTSELTSTIVMGPIKRQHTQYNTELREALLDTDDETAQKY